MSRRLLGLLLAVAAGSSLAAQQSQNSRASTGPVAIDVSVTDDARAVDGLTVDDFALTDNGVVQHLDSVVPHASALDVSLLLDVSGSVTGALEDNLVEDARTIQAMLGADDKIESVLVGREARRGTGLQDMNEPRPPRIADGGTRLFDAILTAALEKGSPGRRHVIIALTDGLDTASVFDRATRATVLSRSEAVVHMAAISLSERKSGFVAHARGPAEREEEEGDYDDLLREVTDATGGTFYDVRPGDGLVESFRADLDHLRRCYSLSYHPTGVPAPGWHTLTVKLTRSQHDVHARGRYFHG